jgi:hypothetical protein
VIDGRRDYGKEEFVIYENSDVIGHTWEVSSIPGVYAKNVINGCGRKLLRIDSHGTR